MIRTQAVAQQEQHKAEGRVFMARNEDRKGVGVSGLCGGERNHFGGGDLDVHADVLHRWAQGGSRSLSEEVAGEVRFFPAALQIATRLETVEPLVERPVGDEQR